MLVGITLPQFREDPEDAIDAARHAERIGLDGVFVFDHLWPLGRPDRPALHSFTLLGALAAETERIALGTLVARVGLLPDAVLIHEFETLQRMAPGRVIAALGVGDGANRPENDAYGVRFAPRDERLEHMIVCARGIRALGIPVWFGGNSTPIRKLAATEADGWNAWGAPVELFAAAVQEGLPAMGTWAGQVLTGRSETEAAEKLAQHGARPNLVHGEVAGLTAHLAALAEAGAGWAICAPLDVGANPGAIEYLAEAKAAAQLP